MSITGTGAILQAASQSSGVGYLAPGMNGFQNPNTPNIVDFLTFLNTTVQIPSAALPASSPWPQYALSEALTYFDPCAVGPGPGANYSVAVYNCATHILLTITPDVSGQTYFATVRGNPPTGFGLIQPSTGLVAATYDQGTGATLAQPEWAPRLTVDQLDFFKTPYGRRYLAWQQAYGPSIVGLT